MGPDHLGAGWQIVCVGVSHHQTPVALRERLALDEEGVAAELSRLMRDQAAREALLVNTCNRVELYAVVPPGGADALMAGWVQRAPGLDPRRHLYVHRDVDAVRHLFRVASSLDSLVVGEPQILGQVKEAVRQAGEVGSLGAVLHRLTQRALAVAKDIRTHTEIGRHNVGIGNAGVWLAQQIFSSLKGRRALLVGTGEMGRQVATAMVGAGISELVVASRTLSRAVEIAEPFGGTAIGMDRLESWVSTVDIVITATTSPVPVIHADLVRNALRARRSRPLFIVDLAVPRNVAREVDTLDQAFLFNVDDLISVVDKGQQARQAAAVDAERRAAEEADRFASRIAQLEVHEDIGRVTRAAEVIRQAELARSQRWMAGLDPAVAAQVDAMTRSLVKKLLHAPISSLRRAAEAGEAEKVEALRAAWAEAPREGRDGGPRE